MFNSETETKQLDKLIQAIHNDPVINERIILILKMDSYPRRFVLNNWLEQLRQNNAPQDLLSALSCLFDDTVAELILMFIHEHN
jgi:hypothetical protein